MQKLKNVYLVGGAVRDQLLGMSSHDKDYVVVGASIKDMLANGFKPVGKDFPVFLHPETKDEYALARTERKVGKGYTGFQVDASENVSLEDDLARRDLSINAMALDEHGNIIDPFNGQHDLEQKVLRHTTAAFVEDPVRVLRVARFLARYGNEWKIHDETKALFWQMKEQQELSALVPERVWKETEKALNEPHPHLYFEALDGLGIFPELECMHNVKQSATHHPEGDVWIHTMLVLKRAADLQYDLPTRFAALTHDFGKPVVYAQTGKLHGHEAAGVPIIDKFCQRLRVPNKLKELAELTSYYHLHTHKMAELTPKTLYKVVIGGFNAVKQPARFLQFLHACECDSQGRGPTKENQEYKSLAFGKYLLDGLIAFDTKVIVKEAIEKGKTGPDIGEAVRIAQIQAIAALKDAYASKA